jgi:hypothetical protein
VIARLARVIFVGSVKTGRRKINAARRAQSPHMCHQSEMTFLRIVIPLYLLV